ncbi:MAG: radical SAM protein [Clostridiales bacterium]|nr:radical SAM protein [Clostridiales bacterium]
MKVKVFQKGFNFSQDGPGNRLVYHLQGCNMRCPWCSNPEGMSMEPLLNCGFKCEEYDVSEMLDETDRSSMMFFDGGGVTFTGGEATMQFDALYYLLSELKKKGINTALETNGSHARLPELFPLIDFLIMDIKHYDDNKHLEATGFSNKTILKNAVAACLAREQVLFRIPLIGGFNSSENDAERFSELFNGFGENKDVEVLRYHEFGKDKWKKCGIPYKMRDAFISDDEYIAFCKILKNSGIRLIGT